MSVQNLTVGIDYHLHSLRVSVLSPEGRELGNASIENDVEKFIRYVSGFGGSVRGVAIEACEGSARFADEVIRRANWRVELCHPGYAQRMRHNPDKTDCHDAYLMADLSRVGYLPKVWLAPEDLRDLRTLVRYRASVSAQAKEQKQRIRSILRRERIKLPPGYKTLWSQKARLWLESFAELPEHTLWVFKRHLAQLKSFEEELKESEKRLTEFAERDPLITELMKQPGIGVITATILRAEIGTFTRFMTGKEFARFCGLTPKNASSGQRQADAGLVKAGNPILKTALIQVGHNLCRYHPDYRERARRMLSAGKKKGVVIAAMTNRWARRFFYLMRDFETRGSESVLTAADSSTMTH